MITPQQMADVTNYFYAAQALNPVEGMSAVWADYVNAELPELTPDELLPASRDCLKTWAAEGRTWRVDLPRFVASCKKIRKARVTAYQQKYGDPVPEGDLPVDAWLAWKKAATLEIMRSDDATPQTVASHAWEAIGQTPPAIETTTKRKLNLEKIGR